MKIKYLIYKYLFLHNYNYKLININKKLYNTNYLLNF